MEDTKAKGNDATWGDLSRRAVRLRDAIDVTRKGAGEEDIRGHSYRSALRIGTRTASR
jgi:hypothetical protein